MSLGIPDLRGRKQGESNMATIIGTCIGFVFGTLFGFIITFVLISEKNQPTSRNGIYEKNKQNNKANKRK